MPPKFLKPCAFLIAASCCSKAAPVGLVINEVHYDSEPTTEFVEFVELLNTETVPLDLSGCGFTDGISVTFPPGTTLGAAEFLLLAEDPLTLVAKFPDIPAGTQIFAYSGSLSNNGERLQIRDSSAAVIDEVSYRAEFPWPIAANGEGASMQLIEPTLDNDLGGAWRAAVPTPGRKNLSFAVNAPPMIRQVGHAPTAPSSVEATTITAKITDSDGISSVDLLYQVVSPGNFIPARLPNTYGTLTSNPGAPQPPNPTFEDPSNWTIIPMIDGGEGIFSAAIPALPNRTLVRYRISAEDKLGASVRVPYPDDPSLNFAYFIYDGVPDYVAGSTTHPAATLTALPIYTMITRDNDRAYAYAYSSTGDGGFQIPKGNAARGTYNWECALVYDGVVYDHVGWRLRQNNDRYAGNGKRSMRFRMNRGHYFQARGEDGKKLPVKWKRFNTSKMSRFGGTNSYGLHETINSKLWRMVGVECPQFLPAHWRMIDGAEEAPDQYSGDFFGLATIVQEIDGTLLDERGLPDGNIYKLKDGVTDPLELQRNQSRTAVDDGSDFANIKSNLDSSQNDLWLRAHVDWDQWARYHAVVEAVRHYDYGTPSTHLKNRAWYFMEQAGTPHGLLRIIPHDHDASWARGYHDNLNSVGNSIGTGFPWAAIFDDIRRPPGGTEKPEFTRDYRNFIRGFRQLLWQEETVETIIDDHVALLELFSLADRDRWTGGPAAAGSEQMTAIALIGEPMKNMAFVSDSMYGSELAGGRGAFLDQIAADPAIPDQPVITYTGTQGFPLGGLQFTSSAFSDPQGNGTFSSMQWRIAEVSQVGDAGEIDVLPAGSTWRYLDDGSDQGTAWRAAVFDDSSWSSGATPAGYGTITGTSLVTPIDPGPDSGNRHATTYFRTTVDIADPAEIGGFTFALNLDDGAVVYVNGQEVLRDGFDPDTAVTYDKFADASGNEGSYDTFRVPPSFFASGKNTIAVEVHQDRGNSSDLGFDLSISASPATPERKFEWFANWESGEIPDFQPSITPPASATRADRSYRARVRHQDTSGGWSLWSEPLEFAPTLPDLSLYTDSLVISEIMYHPPDPTPAEIAAGFDDDDYFEYIELRNVGTQTLDLSDVRFTKGVDIDLAGTLPPGEYLLVVNNVAAFEMRYGAGQPVAGAWSGKLDNGGEQIKLSFGAGEPIRDFVYDDLSPWPEGTDGGGSSLVLVYPFSLPDHGDPFSWRAAAPGTPGGSDGTSFPGGDLIGYATRGSANIDLLPSGQSAYSVELNQLAEDLVITTQISTDLTSWLDADLMRTQVAPSGDGFAATTYVVTHPPGTTRWFVRLSIETR